MGKKQPGTPRSRVRSALRQLYLRSRERAAALKRDEYTCTECQIKQSRAKGREVYVEVHHKTEIRWKEIIDMIYEELLIHPDGLETLCKECHKQDNY